MVHQELPGKGENLEHLDPLVHLEHLVKGELWDHEDYQDQMVLQE